MTTSTTRRVTTLDRIRVERFRASVDTNGPLPASAPELGPCHVWKGPRQGDGRGKFSIDDREFLAHRVAFFLAHGHWPQPCCLHKCDGGAIGCVNPAHLVAGTYSDNTRDMVAKNRCKRAAARGEAAGRARLTEQQALEIREATATRSASHAQLARRFGVGRSTIWGIASGTTWRHLEKKSA